MPRDRITVVQNASDPGRLREDVVAFTADDVCRTRGAEKARMLAVPDVLLVPAAAGLVVLDSFAAGVAAVISSAWPSLWPHGPEAAYIRHGRNGLVVDDDGDPCRYVRAVADLLADRGRRQRLEAGCVDAAAEYTIEEMVERFAAGIERGPPETLRPGRWTKEPVGPEAAADVGAVPYHPGRPLGCRSGSAL